MTWKIHDLHDAIFGVDARKQAGDLLKEYGTKRTLIVCGPNIHALGYPDELAGILRDAGISSAIYIKEEGEPTGGVVDKGAAIARAEEIDGIVGLGGGSSMDTAKMIGKVLANGVERAEDLLGGYTALNLGSKVYSPVLLLSTTAGTGSEVSWGLMCENMDNKKKTFCLHPAAYAIIDPVYYTSLPQNITACCGMDSLAHSLESLCNSAAMPIRFERPIWATPFPISWWTAIASPSEPRCPSAWSHSRATTSKRTRRRPGSGRRCSVRIALMERK